MNQEHQPKKNLTRYKIEKNENYSFQEQNIIYVKKNLINVFLFLF